MEGLRAAPRGPYLLLLTFPGPLGWVWSSVRGPVAWEEARCSSLARPTQEQVASVRSVSPESLRPGEWAHACALPVRAAGGFQRK